MCILTERDWESSWLRASVSLHVKTSVCSRDTIIKDKEIEIDMQLLSAYSLYMLVPSGLFFLLLPGKLYVLVHCMPL